MELTKKRIIGWLLVAVYTIAPFIEDFPIGVNSHIEFWGWANFPFIIAIWEFLIKDWLMKD